MKNKEKARQYDLLYRRQHKVAIRIKNRVYKRLPHVKALFRDRRRRYFQEYYKKHREKLLQHIKLWTQNNKDKRRVYCRRYKEKLKMRNYFSGPKIKRVVDEFLVYCKNRYHPEIGIST